MAKIIIALILTLAMAASATLVFAEGYKHDIEAIKRQCQKKIVIIQQELEKQEQKQAQEEKAKEIQDIFDQAESLYQKGQLKQAQALYDQAYQLSGDPSLKSYVKQLQRERVKEKKALLKALKEKKRLKAKKLREIEKLKKELAQENQ